MTHDQRLASLGIKLPTPLKPFGVYRPVVTYPVGNYIHLSLSGHGPFQVEDNKLLIGKCGTVRTKEEGNHAAYLTALGCLSTIRNQLGGSLNRVKRVIKSLVMVNGDPTFQEQIYVANGFAQVFKDVFGAEAGVGARSAIGMGSLPMNQTVEVEMIVEVEAEVQEVETKQINTDEYWVDSIPELDNVINCCGHFTSLGGSRLHPNAFHAMQLQSQRFVDLNALLQHAGSRIALLAKAPKGYSAHVTGGAASAIALTTVACMFRNINNIQQIEQLTSMLPHLNNHLCCHVIVDGCSDLRWLSQIELTGAIVHIIGNSKQPMNVKSITLKVKQLGGWSRIACFVLFDGAVASNLNNMSLEDVINVSNATVPVVVDAAARLPPIANLWNLTKRGASAVLFSGGKAIRGPQSSGFVIARNNIIKRIHLYACPREDSVCRAMKTTKESIVGLVAALEAFVIENQEYPKIPNILANIVAMHIRNRLRGDVKTTKITDNIIIRQSTGQIEGLLDVQPNQHNLISIDLQNVIKRNKFQNEGTRKTKEKDTTMYGDGVNHGSPLNIVVRDAPTMLASKLCRVAVGVPRVAVNTTKQGIFINPILLTSEEAKYVGKRVADEIIGLVLLNDVVDVDSGLSKL